MCWTLNSKPLRLAERWFAGTVMRKSAIGSPACPVMGRAVAFTPRAGGRVGEVQVRASGGGTCREDPVADAGGAAIRARCRHGFVVERAADRRMQVERRLDDL